MKIIEREGKTIAEIVEDFAKKEGLRKNQFEYEIISEGSKGFLGLFGMRQAKIRFKIAEPQDKLRNFLSEFFHKIDITYQTLEIINEENYIKVRVEGSSDPGFLIGKEGRFINALQYLLNRALGNEDKLKIILDIDGYRQRHEKNIIERLKVVLPQLKKTGKKLTLDPMSPKERRVVHQYVEKVGQLRTLTIGKGEKKRVIIFPQEGELPKNAPQAENYKPSLRREKHSRLEKKGEQEQQRAERPVRLHQQRRSDAGDRNKVPRPLRPNLNRKSNDGEVQDN